MNKPRLLLKSQPVPKCLFPDCGKEAQSRGLCRNHYTYALAYVRSGRTTWDDLEKAGKCLKAYSSTTAGFRNWLLTTPK